MLRATHRKKALVIKETFSSVSLKDSFRTIMTLVVHYDIELHQMNVKIASLNIDINEIFFFFWKLKTNTKQIVCKIKKIHSWTQASISTLVFQASSSNHLIQL